MAKEVKKQGQGVELPTNDENVMTNIRERNLLKEDNIAKAIEEIENDNDEKQKREAKAAILCATYQNNKSLIKLRSRRREEKSTKKLLVKSKELLDDLLAKKLTVKEYYEKRTEMKNEFNKENIENDKIYSSELDELRANFGNSFRWDWDY
jgi:hypothetical protein